MFPYIDKRKCGCSIVLSADTIPVPIRQWSYIEDKSERLGGQNRN